MYFISASLIGVLGSGKCGLERQLFNRVLL